MPKGLDKVTSVEDLVGLLKGKAEGELLRMGNNMDISGITKIATESYTELTTSIAQNTVRWRGLIPGRPLFNKFAAAANIGVGRLKRIYLSAAQRGAESPFAEVVGIFREFGQMGRDRA